MHPSGECSYLQASGYALGLPLTKGKRWLMLGKPLWRPADRGTTPARGTMFVRGRKGSTGKVEPGLQAEFVTNS